jgi:sugar phosphate isomerase/epimerase
MKMGITVYGAHLMVPEEGRTVAKIIRQAANVGFDGIDLGYYWGEDKASEFAEAKKVADGEGIQIANYIVGNNFGNAAAEDRLEAEIEKVKTALKEAAYFNCGTLRVFGGGYGLDWKTYSPRIAEALAACVETAKENNVVMALEDHGALCKNSSEQLFYINEVNSPYLRATADIGNFWLPGGELPIVGVSSVAEYVAMVHVKDYVFVNNTPVACPVGEGVIDFKSCFRALKDVNFDGWLSLEYECSIGVPKQGITTSLVNMRRFAASC